MKKNLLILPGDHIGPEIMAEAEKVLQRVVEKFDLDIATTHGLLGGAAIEATGIPLPDDTLEQAKQADAILLGAVGGPEWDNIDMAVRPEKGLDPVPPGDQLARLDITAVAPAAQEHGVVHERG